VLGPTVFATALVMSRAHAQEVVPEVAVPAINVQAWRMPVDAEATLWTDDASSAPDHYVEARLAYTYLRHPLVYRYTVDGGPTRELGVLDNVHQANLVAAYSYWALRVGLDLPLLLAANGAQVQAGAGLGDVALDVKGVILDREGAGAPLGVAAVSRLALPTASVEGAALGSDGPVWELSGVVDHELGPVLLAGNLGTRVRRPSTVGDIDWRGQAFFRLGAGWSLAPEAGVSADLVGALGYGNPAFDPATTPMELLLGGFGRPAGDLMLRGGVGTALTAGVSAPDLRLIVAAGWEPKEVRDKDGDGVTDRLDACPLDPEDKDRHKDEDGCPDPSTKVHVLVQDHFGDVIFGADLGIETPLGPKLGTGDTTVELHPGSYPLSVQVPRFAPHVGALVVPAAPTHEHIIKLEPLFGEVRVVVQGVDDLPLNGSARLGAGGGGRISGGVARFEADPGRTEVIVQIEGYQPASGVVSVQAGDLVELVLQLQPARARVVADRIEIVDKVFFDVGKASIKAQSFPLLDEVARVLVENPQLLRVSVDGHTDDQGSAKVNTKLSAARAESVRAYLESKGVAADRLVAAGYGPSRPLVPGKTPEAREQNRRVEFVILEQALRTQ
jgi:outer membrane protein OmpA-like peptidoglycan-associated protein